MHCDNVMSALITLLFTRWQAHDQGERVRDAARDVRDSAVKIRYEYKVGFCIYLKFTTPYSGRSISIFNKILVTLYGEEKPVPYSKKRHSTAQLY